MNVTSSEAFAFVGAAGYAVREILEYKADGTVVFEAERPVNPITTAVTTDRAHLCIKAY